MNTRIVTRTSLQDTSIINFLYHNIQDSNQPVLVLIMKENLKVIMQDKAAKPQLHLSLSLLIGHCYNLRTLKHRGHNIVIYIVKLPIVWQQGCPRFQV